MTEFFRTDAARKGQFPRHVGNAVFDRLQVIRDASDWNRCLIMDHDMLALCDLAPYFKQSFDGNLLMGRMFGPENTLGFQMTGRGELPHKLKHAENYPYFYMGPMMNLKAMRKEGTWEKLLQAHETLGQDEQMALTIATEGRVKGLGRKWNLVPHWDNLADGSEGPERSLYGTTGEAATWKNGLPEGIIHWTGWAKPWHPETKVWRPDLWEAEETSWEALRNGWWEKPRAAVVESVRGRKSVSLARRGWKVDFFPVTGAKEEEAFLPPSPPKSPASILPWIKEGAALAGPLESAEPLKPMDESPAPPPFPDLFVHGPLEAAQEDEWAGVELPEEVEFVGFGPGISAPPFLRKRVSLPATIILQGPVALEEMRQLRKIGYTWETRIKRDDWPDGGPAPSVLDFSKGGRASKVGVEEDVYLRVATSL